MTEKRQGRESTADTLTAGTEQEDALLERLPDGLAPLVTITDETAAELLELAERQVSEARKKMGPQASKPRLKRVQDLFNSKAGRAPRVSEDVDRLMRSTGVATQIANADAAFDHTMAGAYNIFDRSSVNAGSSFQTAYDNWTMAVRIYKADLRTAGAILADQIRAAKHLPALLDYDYETPARGQVQVDHYTAADKIGDAILAYEKSMQVAGTALAMAYGVLLSGLYSAVTALAVAEATLIASAQGAYKSFWTSAQTALGQTRT